MRPQSGVRRGRKREIKGRPLARAVFTDQCTVNAFHQFAYYPQPQAGRGFPASWPGAEPAVPPEHGCPVLFGETGAFVPDGIQAAALRRARDADPDLLTRAG